MLLEQKHKEDKTQTLLLERKHKHCCWGKTQTRPNTNTIVGAKTQRRQNTNTVHKTADTDQQYCMQKKYNKNAFIDHFI